jgi:hypothetical protein
VYQKLTALVGVCPKSSDDSTPITLLAKVCALNFMELFPNHDRTGRLVCIKSSNRSKLALSGNGFLRSSSFGLDDTSCGHLQSIRSLPIALRYRFDETGEDLISVTTLCAPFCLLANPRMNRFLWKLSHWLN